VTFGDAIGAHGRDAVAASLAQLAREGMLQLETKASGSPRARLVA
jgi:hypothetical protein